MLLNILVLLILSCNYIIVSSYCPHSHEWRNMRISPGGPLVCARLYGDRKCSGFPLPFGINSSSSDLGTKSSSTIDFISNNVTALVRPGCNMFLWEGANFTGRIEKSTNYLWHLDRRHFSSALCNCSVDDVELLQCELREHWEEVNFCDFRESNFGGLCSVTLKRSYITEGNGEATNTTVTKNLANLFAGKIIESIGVKRMTTFLDVNSNDKLAYSFLVEARTELRSSSDPERDEWIYSHISKTNFWFSSMKVVYSTAKEYCRNETSELARFDTAELINWTKSLIASEPDLRWWVYNKREKGCTYIVYDSDKSTRNRSELSTISKSHSSISEHFISPPLPPTDIRLDMRTIMAIVIFNYTFNLVLTHDRPENETFGKPRTEAEIEFSKEESELYQIAEDERQQSERVLQRSVAVTNSKYPKAVTENPKAEPGPQYSAIDYHVRVIAYLRCRGSPVAGQLVELRKKDKPKDKLLDRRDTDKDGMVDLGGHDDDDDGIESYISIKHTCHPRPSCVYCTSKFKVPQERTCKGPCPEDKYWGAGIELTAYECHCHQPRKALKYWRDE